MGAQQNCDKSGSQIHVPGINKNWQVYGINETHWTAIYRYSTGWVMGSRIVALEDFIVSVPFPIMFTVCGWRTKPWHRYTCRNQLNIVLYVKNQKLTEDAGSLVNIISSVYLACMSEIYEALNRDISRVHEMCAGDLELLHYVTYVCPALPQYICLGGWWA